MEFFMQILREIPGHMQNGLNAAAGFVQNLPSRISSTSSGIFNNFSLDQIIPQAFNGWYERNIRPLDRYDGISLAIGLVASAVLLKYALKWYGDAALPLGLCAGGIIVSGLWMFSRTRVQQHFDDQVWEKIDLIRRAANDITSTNQDFSAISAELAALEKPEFSHLQEDLKRLDKQTREFRADATAPNYRDKRDIAKAHLATLAPKVLANAQDKAILDALEQEIDKVGTDQQNFGTIETNKQKLRDLQTPQAIAEQAELSRQIDDLVKTAQGPDFSKTKQDYLIFLKGVQQKLSRSKDVEDLP